MKKAVVYTLFFILNLIGITHYAQENRRESSRINAQAEETFFHTIEAGQTVYSIARMYGVGEDDLYRMNPKSKELIKVGEKLRIPQKEAASKITAAKDELDYAFHTIEAKETLYALSKTYNVPAKEIMEANPGLSIATFSTGKTIRIPTASMGNVSQKEEKLAAKEIEYKVEKRETMFRLTRKFNITSEELIKRNPELKNGVKAGMTLKIPVSSVETVNTYITTVSEPREREVNAMLNTSNKIENVSVIKAVVLLPFMTGEATTSQETPRLVEYYEGLLLAVDSLKNRGISISLTVRDTGKGTQKLQQILKERALQEANLIIGAVDNDQINMIADFAKKNEIKYVIPFSASNDEVLSNSNVFLVNTPQSYMNERAAKAAFDQLFYDYNIIFVDTKDRDDKAEFVKRFKLELTNRKVVFRDLVYNQETFAKDVEGLLSKSVRNVVIPISSTLETLNKIRIPLRMIADARPEYILNLFGYREWQTYTRDALDDLFALDTYIFTNFYADNMSQEVLKFNTKYKIWFSKHQLTTFPKYGIWGFDTGMFFFDAIHKYGVNFENHLDKMRYKSLQTGFDFVRPNNWGGYINTNIFIVHYNKRDYTVVRHDIK